MLENAKQSIEQQNKTFQMIKDRYKWLRLDTHELNEVPGTATNSMDDTNVFNYVTTMVAPAVQAEFEKQGLDSEEVYYEQIVPSQSKPDFLEIEVLDDVTFKQVTVLVPVHSDFNPEKAYVDDSQFQALIQHLLVSNKESIEVYNDNLEDQFND
jgi:hypothetical protein